MPQDDGALTAVDGDTLIMFVTWDRAGRLSSQSIHQFGSATLDKTSKHYDDQVPLFVARKLKPVLFARDQLKGRKDTEADYAPGQSSLGDAPCPFPNSSISPVRPRSSPAALAAHRVDDRARLHPGRREGLYLLAANRPRPAPKPSGRGWEATASRSHTIWAGTERRPQARRRHQIARDRSSTS